MNSIKFKGEQFSQISGAMIGTPFAVEFSCLFMSHPRTPLSEAYPDRNPLALFCYIDDIIGISDIGNDELRSYLDFIQNIHPCLDYTKVVSDSVNMLDTTLSIHGDRIKAKLQTYRHSQLSSLEVVTSNQLQK